jgi:hypothetical protein
MREANDANSKNTYVIQRPFIYSSRLDMAPITNQSGISSFNVNPAIYNGGNTAPKTLTIFVNYGNFVDAIAPDFAFPDLDSVVISTGAGAPKDFIRISPKNFTLAEMEAFAEKKRYLYVYGHVEYDDAFVASPHHVTMFCYELTGIRGGPDRGNIIPAIPQGAGAMLVFEVPTCRKHNCTDEGCTAQVQHQK